METTPRTDEDSLVALGRRVGDDAARLVRAEIELAKAQAIEAVKRVAIAAAMLAVAGLLVLFMAIFALAALPERFGGTLLGDSWKGWGVMAALFLVTAMALVGLGVSRVMRTVRATKGTVDSMKEDVAWAKRLTRRDGRSS